MVVSAIINDKVVEMEYSDIKALVNTLRKEARRIIINTIDDSENGMTTSDLKKAFHLSGHEVSGLLHSEYDNSNCSSAPLRFKTVKKARYFVEVDENGIPLANGSVRTVRTNEVLYYSRNKSVK